jgi:hypothetical protein
LISGFIPTYLVINLETNNIFYIEYWQYSSSKGRLIYVETTLMIEGIRRKPTSRSRRVSPFFLMKALICFPPIWLLQRSQRNFPYRILIQLVGTYRIRAANGFQNAIRKYHHYRKSSTIVCWPTQAEQCHRPPKTGTLLRTRSQKYSSNCESWLIWQEQLIF